jgi:hypothetical protein
MGNMSYCRFQNTFTDLRDCQVALEEIDNDLDELSPDEKRYAKRLIEICREISQEFDGIEID